MRTSTHVARLYVPRACRSGGKCPVRHNSGHAKPLRPSAIQVLRGNETTSKEVNAKISGVTSSSTGPRIHWAQSRSLSNSRTQKPETVSKAQTQGILHTTSLNATRLLNCIPNVLLDASTSRPHAVTILKTDNKVVSVRESSLVETANIAQTFENLVDSLELLALAEAPDAPLLVLFATKSFAAELYNRPELLARSVSKVVGPQLPHCHWMQVLVAIVDKLPNPNIEHTHPESTLSPNVPLDLGSEGICIASSSSKHFGTSAGGISNWSPEASRLTHSLEPDKPATVTCLVPPLHHHVLEKIFSDPQRSVTKTIDTYSVQVPLPSTIFENGQRHTLMQILCSRLSGSDAWQCNDVRLIQHAQVTLPFNLNVGAHQNAHLALPLVKLTETLRVKACRGNIVRRVQGLADDEKVMRPASEALEAAVAKYFVDKGVRPHGVSVWALIIPPKATETSSSHDDVIEALALAPTKPHAEPPAWLGDDDLRPLQDLVNRGAKLRKVTSGGGGWGNKAGLLALDPETSFDGRMTTDLNEVPGLEVAGDIMNMSLEDIAEPGDLLQFYLCPPEVLEGPESPVAGSEAPATEDGPARHYKQAFAGRFGVIPSTIDEMHPLHDQAQDNSMTSTPLVVRNWFGALSEKGMSIQTRSFSGWENKIVSKTQGSKVDVPFATLHLDTTREQ